MGATRRCFFSWEGDVCENVLEPRSGLRLHAQGYGRGPLGRTQLQFTWVRLYLRLSASSRVLFLMFSLCG